MSKYEDNKNGQKVTKNSKDLLKKKQKNDRIAVKEVEYEK